MIQFLPAIAVSLAAGLVTYLIAKKDKSHEHEKSNVESGDEHACRDHRKQRCGSAPVHGGGRVSDNIKDHPTKARKTKNERPSDESDLSGDGASDDSRGKQDTTENIRKTKRVSKKSESEEEKDNEDGTGGTDNGGDDDGGDVSS